MTQFKLIPASALAALLALAVGLLSGCASLTAEEQTAPPTQSSSMGMGAGGGDGGVMAAAVVADARDATMTLGPDATSQAGVVVDRVVAPRDGWVVVRSATPPGVVLGKTLVRKGANEGVVVPLAAADGAQARLALHVDRGALGGFEFDPQRVGRNMDGPVYAGRSPVELPLSLDGYGVNVEANSVLILVEDQKIANDELLVSYFITPGPSWISVNEVAGGLPGRRIGLKKTGAGEVQQVRIPLEGRPESGELVVTVHADRGVPGSFEYEVTDPLGSSDQPYRSANVVVSGRISVK